MTSKCLEKKIEILPLENAVEFPIELEYYLLESEMVDYEEMGGAKVYGLEIVKRVNETLVEEEIVENFSCCKENVKEILNKLARNAVTPMGLPFILDDMLGV